ncbi:hypothetical protein LCGC14_0848100 [marine sediment metagenome]|uniref:Uncharacterized protein n=1 Tax=marine sediment metagenome TaxID=412755 RepID=A0A0F9PFY1_9ZZZZ
MVRGLPDDANVQGYGDISGGDDQAALAVRLGTAAGYSKRPVILYLDDFSTGADSWTVERSSVEENATLTGDYTLTGGAALLFNPADDSSEFMTAEKTLAEFPDAIYGLFAMVGISPDNPNFRLQLVVYDGFHIRTYMLMVNATTQELLYKDSAGSSVVIGTGINSMSALGHFHALGVVVDLENDAYMQLTVDGVAYDLSGIATQAVLNGTAPRIVVSVYTKNDGSGVANAAVDSIGFVQNPLQL